MYLPHKVVLLTVVIATSACQEAATSLVIPEGVNADPMSQSLLSADEQRLFELVRAMAIALLEPSSRRYLNNSLSNSPFRENKRLLTDLLAEDRTGALTRSIEENLQYRPDGLTALLDSLPRQLEVYFPLEHYRQSWTPEAAFAVVTMFNDNGPIWRFDAEGHSGQLSRDTAPTLPHLSIVFAEGSYPNLTGGEDLNTRPEGAGETVAAQSGSVLVKLLDSTIYDAGGYDPWPLGAPEFEIHAYKSLDGEDEATWTACAGQNASLGYQYNQNNNTWSGEATLVDLQTEPDATRFGLQVWEKDQMEDCIHPYVVSGQPVSDEDVVGQVKSDIVEGGKIALSCGLFWTMGTGNPVAGAFATAGCAAFLTPMFGIMLITGGANADEYVGTLSRPKPECFSDATGPLFYHIRRGSYNAGYAYLDVSGPDRAPICVQGSFSGPVYISSPGNYTWAIQNVTGGDGTYTYQWSYRLNFSGAEWEYLGTSATQSLHVSSLGPDDFTMRVQVFSASLDYVASQLVVNSMADSNCPGPEVIC